jgi:polar amino acid transport system substrate-binding protein
MRASCRGAGLAFRLLAFLFCAVALLVTSSARADLLSDVRQRGVIRVGVAVGVPLFSYLDARQELAGSDVDTARLLASDMGVRLEIVRLTNAERITAIETGTVDVVVSSLSITPEREQQVGFSIPYARLYVVLAGRPVLRVNGYADLAGLEVGVTRNTASGALVARFAPRARLVAFDSDMLLIEAAVAGRLDLFSTQGAVLDAVNRLAGYKMFEEKFVQHEFDLAVAMPRRERALRTWINAWVFEQLRSGRLNEIYRRHHGRDLPAELRPAASGR